MHHEKSREEPSINVTNVESVVKAAGGVGRVGEGDSLRESSDITFERYLEIKIENESPDATMSVPYSPLNEGIRAQLIIA